MKFPWRKRDFLTFSDGDAVAYAEIHLAATEQREHEGLVEKEILRTGSWPVIPTRGGKINKPLTIIRDGKSDREKGIIALSELVENFTRVGQRVQIPLTDDNDDHKNTLRLNTGFVKSLRIVDKGAGDARLVALMDFTEDEVKEKVLRGTYADVSCGIPWEFASRGESYGAVLEHVAITNRPFIDDLGPFLALSDGDEPVRREVDHFSAAPSPDPEPVAPPPAKIVDPFGGLSIKQVMEQATSVLPEAMRETFSIIDVKANGIVIQNDEAKLAWRVPFNVVGDRLVSTPEGWTWLEYKGEATPLVEREPTAPLPETPPAETEENPPAPKATEAPKDPQEAELEAARQLRQARLGAVAASQTTTKEAHMPLTREELEQLNLSDLPEGQRAAIQKLLDDNSSLAASSRESEADKRVTELEELGFKDKPGALKLYRQIMLADDGGPAVVVLSDDGKTKQSKSALSILDDFIESIKGAEGKVHLSDQAHLVNDDPKPPNTPEGEKRPLPERIADAKAALAGVHGA